MNEKRFFTIPVNQYNDEPRYSYLENARLYTLEEIEAKRSEKYWVDFFDDTSFKTHEEALNHYENKYNTQNISFDDCILEYFVEVFLVYEILSDEIIYRNDLSTW